MAAALGAKAAVVSALAAADSCSQRMLVAQCNSRGCAMSSSRGCERFADCSQLVPHRVVVCRSIGTQTIQQPQQRVTGGGSETNNAGDRSHLGAQQLVAGADEECRA